MTEAPVVPLGENPTRFYTNVCDEAASALAVSWMQADVDSDGDMDLVVTFAPLGKWKDVFPSKGMQTAVISGYADAFTIAAMDGTPSGMVDDNRNDAIANPLTLSVKVK